MSRPRSKRQQTAAYQKLVAQDQTPKRCPKCKQMKPAASFVNSNQMKISKWCGQCQDVQRKKYWESRSGQRRLRHHTPNRHYTEYMSSPEWRRKRAEYFESGRPTCCYICGAPKDWDTQLHHRTYANLGHENLDDLVPVCPAHHKEITDGWLAVRSQKGPKGTLWQYTELVRKNYQDRP